MTQKSRAKKEIMIGDKVYVKMANSSPERIFTITKIVDEVWVEIEHFDGIKHIIDRSKVHYSPTPTVIKKKILKRRGKSIPTISTPMGGQPLKRQRRRDSVDEILREQRLSSKKKTS